MGRGAAPRGARAPPRRGHPPRARSLRAAGRCASATSRRSARSRSRERGADAEAPTRSRVPRAAARADRARHQAPARASCDDGMPTIILCDNAGQAERLDELLGESAARASSAALAIGVLDGGFVIPAAGACPDCACSPITRSSVATGASGARAATPAAARRSNVSALKAGDYVVHLEHGVGIYRGIEKIFVGESTIEAAVIEYEGGDRLNVPLYRIDQIERYRAARDVSTTTRRRRGCTSSAAVAGSSSATARASAIQEMTRGAARSLCPPQHRARVRRTFPTAPGSASWNRASSSRIRPTSATRHAGRETRYGVRAPDGPPAGGRRRIRQDRDRDSRGVQGGAVGEARSRCSCPRPSSPNSTRALSATGSPTFPSPSRPSSRFQTAKEQAAVLAALAREAGRHRHRHAPPAQPRREFRAISASSSWTRSIASA